MLGGLAKAVLVASSMSPILLLIGIDQSVSGEVFPEGAAWLLSFLVAIFACWGMLRLANRRNQSVSLSIQSFERRDQEALTFLVTYFFPVLLQREVGLPASIYTTVAALLVIGLVIVHANALHFNPLMQLLGYRFYSAKDENGVAHLLISKKRLRKPGQSLTTVVLTADIYLHEGEKDAD